MILDYDALDGTQRYKAMSQTVIPRPIAWIVTEDEEVINAAPFSYFTPLSSNPATIIVSIGHKSDMSPKDTLHNIRKHKKATICFVNIDNLEDMKNSANPHKKEESEVEIYNIKTQSILEEFPPIIASTQSALFCELHSEVPLDGRLVPVILEIKQQYVDNQNIDDNNNISIKNIGRVGKTFADLNLL